MKKYINLCAQYGVRQDMKFPYANIEEILAEMDRLGIWQTVVEFPANANSLDRNQTLLKDLEQIPNWKERLIPCFILDPGSVVQIGAMDQIREMLQNHRPCCVSLYPFNNNFRLRLAAMALEKVADLVSVVLIDARQVRKSQSGWDDLIELAGLFPDINFVIRQNFYQGCPDMFDVMRRTKNVHVDIGMFHFQSAIETFAKFFGTDRILFSTPSRTVGGAPMASLVYSDLSEEEKDNIRYGNFIRLFRDADDRAFLQKNLKAIPGKVQNSFWNQFMEGKGLRGVDIYDVHTHLGPAGSNWYLPHLTFESQIAAFEKEMDLFGIKKIVSSVSGRFNLIQSNLDLENAVEGKEDRFKGYVRYNPNLSNEFTEEYLDARMSGKYFVGLKTLPVYMKVDIRDERYFPMFRYADKHHLPVLIHCWEGSFGNAAACGEAAKKWPSANVILGHSGGGDTGIAQCYEIAKNPECNNVWFEFCGSFFLSRPWSVHLQHIDYRRVLFGTDAALHQYCWELGRLLSDDIPDEQLIAILGGNAKRLFGF